MIQSVADAQGIFQTNSTQQKTDRTQVASAGQTSFADFLKQSINDLNTSQVTSDKFTAALANGENVELHQVFIASAKASTTMTTALEFRNKVVDAYQEIMRMSV